eukprot:63301_1
MLEKKKNVITKHRSMANCPPTYFCFKCKQIGDHWIMECPKKNRTSTVNTVEIHCSDIDDVHENIQTMHTMVRPSVSSEPESTELNLGADETEQNAVIASSSGLSATAQEFVPQTIEYKQPNNPFLFINHEFEYEIERFCNEGRPSPKYIALQSALIDLVSHCISDF